MRTLAVVIVVVLTGSCGAATEGSSPATKTPLSRLKDYITGIKEPDAFTWVNNLMVDHARSGELNENRNLLRDFMRMPDYEPYEEKWPVHAKLIKLITKMGTDNDCSGIEFKTLSDLAELARGADKEALREKRESRRLNQFMLLCFDASLRQLQTDWDQIDVPTRMQAMFEHELAHLDNMNRLLRPKNRPFESVNEDFKLFEASICRVHKQQDKVYEFSVRELDDLFNDPTSFKVIDIFDDNTVLSEEVAIKIYELFLGEPCKMLTDQRVEGVLNPIFHYYDTNKWDTRATRSIGEKYASLYRWASRWITCRSFNKDKDRIIKLILKGYGQGKDKSRVKDFLWPYIN